jgi:opacity protein-like surface antigen
VSRQPIGILARLLVAGLFLSPTLGLSQKIEIGGAFGGLLYTGDVAPVLNPKFARPGGGVFFKYHFTQAFGLRAQLSTGRLIGTDSITTDVFQKARGASFRNTIREAALMGEYNFRNYIPLRNTKNWTPYVFGGVALFSHGLRQPGDKPMQLAFPLGVGVKYEINRPWTIGIEYSTRFTTTDNLDGLGTPASRTPKVNQSDPDRNDHYTMVFLTVSYTIYDIFCPPGSK